ncbi:hypothetical protein [Halomonas sp. hl-4]|uniref:hypothetical protein n=1 Tax=Halomonas sp. hl-4 TaxID=1761789 RepID=UPI000BB8D16B|nr:hypothetical protein [Halomonas sp. hl-4]SNY96862.1 hypothetical protein SAMN04488142_1421 [Halomonas sp. hl-4]
MGYFFSFLIAIMLAIFTAWIQYYSWFKKERVKFESKEEDIALSLINEISELSHMRVHKQREQVWNLKSKKYNQEVEQEYRKAVVLWNEKIGGFMSKLDYSFSRQEVSFFEDVIQNKFYTIHSEMILRQRSNTSSIHLSQLELELNLLSSELVFFIRRLMGKVRRKDYSTLSLNKEVSFSNRSKLTCEYLFLRLFGLD